MISSCKYFDLRTKTEKNNSEPRQEKEMNYCINCMNSIIKYSGNGYYCWCSKYNKEVRFYEKGCQEHK